ncbi:hypothetical protein D6779_01640, partial [Candidatus Parcubacteria bacterium]
MIAGMENKAMVRILIRNWLLVIVAAFCLSAEGCMSDAIELPANATPTSLLSVQIAPSVVTDEPVSKIQPTSTLVPDISTPLPIKEGWERIDELLATNGNCRLPCFWGITPGKSLRADLEGVLLLFVKNAKHYNFDYPDLGGMSWVKETNELVVNFGLSYWGQKGKPVGILAFRAEAIDIRDGLDSARLTYDSPIFNQQFREYMLPQILTDYGPPDEVYVLTYAGSTVPNLAQPSFYLYLLYPEQGIFIKYTAPWGREGEYVVGCPATAHMEL